MTAVYRSAWKGRNRWTPRARQRQCPPRTSAQAEGIAEPQARQPALRTLLPHLVDADAGDLDMADPFSPACDPEVPVFGLRLRLAGGTREQNVSDLVRNLRNCVVDV